jgi:DNA mismatch endonuclease (patch repair protein)
MQNCLEVSHRDAESDARLRAAGWEVIRIWEHQDAAAAAEQIATAVRLRRASLR